LRKPGSLVNRDGASEGTRARRARRSASDRKGLPVLRRTGMLVRSATPRSANSAGGSLMPSRAQQLHALGQSVWLDFIRRGLLISGEFDRLVRDEGVLGVTSNPTIFQQAITAGTDYDTELAELVAKGLDAPAIFDRLAVEDIQMACDRLRSV